MLLSKREPLGFAAFALLGISAMIQFATADTPLTAKPAALQEKEVKKPAAEKGETLNYAGKALEPPTEALATGEVQMPDGKPAVGVKVMAYSVGKRDLMDTRDQGSFVDGCTDAKGKFRLQLATPGWAVIWIFPKDYVPSTHVIKDKRGDCGVFALEPGPRLRGKVLDAKGRPVPGVNVYAGWRGKNPDITEPVSDQIHRSAVSDDKGEFEMKPLPPGNYIVRPEEFPRDGSLDEKERKERPVPGVFGGTKVTLKAGMNPEPIEVRAMPHVIIEARYVDANGKPTKGHGSFLSGHLDDVFWNTETKVDSDGKMTAMAPHGLEGAQLDVVTNEHGSIRWRKAKGEPLNNTRRISLGTITDDVKGIEIVQYKAPILLVKVVARDGAKPDKQSVDAYYDLGKSGMMERPVFRAGRKVSYVRFEKQEDGRFRSTQMFPDEEVTVTAYAEGYESKPQKVKLAEATTREIELILEKAEAKKDGEKKAAAEKDDASDCSGVVLDKITGKPIAGAVVTVRGVLHDQEQKQENQTTLDTKIKTDGEGKYTFTIPPGQIAQPTLSIVVTVEHPDYAPKTGSGSASSIRQNQKLGRRPFFEKIELRPVAAATGVVLTPDGKPAAGIKVKGCSVPTQDRIEKYQYGDFAETRTDTQGKFLLQLATPGWAVIWILPEDDIPTTRVLKDKRGDCGTVTLQTGIKIRGKVLDVKGKPVVGVNVNAECVDHNDEITEIVPNEIGRSAVTNDKGEFELKPLSLGNYILKPEEYPRFGLLERKNQKRIEVPGVFAGTKVALKAGAVPEPVEVRAEPVVIVEAQHIDANGKPAKGASFSVFGKQDGKSWWGSAKAVADGKMVVMVPHGLERAQIALSITELDDMIGWRKAKGDSLSNGYTIPLGTLNDDLRGIEIVHHKSPSLHVKVICKDGAKPEKQEITALYVTEKNNIPRKGLPGGRRFSNVIFELEKEGRFLSKRIYPDEEIIVTAYAEGYESKPHKVKLAEGSTQEIELILEKVEAKKEGDKK